MKRILYLVQSRIKYLEKHSILETDRSDCVVLTFEEQVVKKNYLFHPNSTWDEGRNTLYYYAKGLKRRYDYYIFLDDDIEFISGNFREFENAILSINAAFIIPHIPEKKYSNSFLKFMMGNHVYSNIIQFDSNFICLSKEVFFDSRILPYNTKYNIKNEKGYVRPYSVYIFLTNLYEYYYKKNIVVIPSVSVIGIKHEGKYHQYDYFGMKKRIKDDFSLLKYKIEKNMPFILINDYCLDLFDKVPLIHMLVRGLYKLFKLMFAFCYAYPRIYIQNISLNRRIQRRQDGS